MTLEPLKKTSEEEERKRGRDREGAIHGDTPVQKECRTKINWPNKKTLTRHHRETWEFNPTQRAEIQTKQRNCAGGGGEHRTAEAKRQGGRETIIDNG